MLYLEDQMTDADGNIVMYDLSGLILDEDGKTTGQKVALDSPGSIILKDGKPVILDENNEELEEHSYTLSGNVVAVYSDELTTVPFNSVTKIF